MPSFYFEQLLRTGLNGIDQQGITAAVLQIAGVILILSLLWAVYEAYSNGGDVRLLGVAAIKYLVLGLVFLNYQSAFRAVNTMFNGVADGIYNLSGGMDVIKAWGNSMSQAWSANPNWFSALWNLVNRRCVSHRARIDIVSWLSTPALHLHAIHALLRTVWVDLVCSRPVCPGADAFARAWANWEEHSS